MGIGGILVAIWTLRKIERQTKATEVAAIAARDSARALVASERAWIHGEIIKYEVITLTRYSLKVTNQGKTPAQIFGYDIWHGLITEGKEFSKQALTTHFTENKYIFIAGGETRTLSDDFEMDDLFTLESGEPARTAGVDTGAFCVAIRYGDVLSEGTGGKQEHETSFVYFYNLLFSSLQRIAEHNKYT